MNPDKFGGMYDGGDEVPFAVPDEYANEGWAKDLKTYPEVWTKLAGSEKLIGQKLEGKIDMLQEGASPEDTEKFYKSIGRPDEAKSYAFDREGQSEAFKKFASEEMDNTVKGIFHKWGLRPDQALGIQKDYEQMLEKEVAVELDAQKKLDEDFENITTKLFGNDKDAIIDSTRVLLEKFVPEGFEEHVQNLDNKSLTVMTGVLNEIKKLYISEDDFNTLKSGLPAGKGGGGESEEALRTEAKKLMSSKEWSDPFNARNKEVREQVSEIYKKIGEME